MKKRMAIFLSAMLLCLMLMPLCAQGECVEWHLGSVLELCTGYAGTAGSSLKSAIKAERILAYSVDNRLAHEDAQAFSQKLAAAYDSLSEEQKEELSGNMMDIFAVLDAAFTDYLSVEELLDSAGILEQIRPLLREEDAQAHYAVFKLTMLEVMGEFDKLLISCTGYAGSAGSSLKNARAACGVLRFSTQCGIAFAEPNLLKEKLSAAYQALSEDVQQELAWNMDSIFSVIDGAFSGNEAVMGLLEDIGAAEEAEYLTDGGYAHWAVFKLQMQAVLEEADQ